MREDGARWVVWHPVPGMARKLQAAGSTLPFRVLKQGLTSQFRRTRLPVTLYAP